MALTNLKRETDKYTSYTPSLYLPLDTLQFEVFRSRMMQVLEGVVKL